MSSQGQQCCKSISHPRLAFLRNGRGTRKRSNGGSTSWSTQFWTRGGPLHAVIAEASTIQDWPSRVHAFKGIAAQIGKANEEMIRASDVVLGVLDGRSWIEERSARLVLPGGLERDSTDGDGQRDMRATRVIHPRLMPQERVEASRFR